MASNTVGFAIDEIYIFIFISIITNVHKAVWFALSVAKYVIEW